MKIVIVEDEIKAAKSLAALIGQLRPDWQITAQLQSVETAIGYFSKDHSTDLVFMDVQLADGISFDIFKSVKLACPVIFCTAYGEYAMDAIKANGIDYILKPFSKEDLQKAIERVEALGNFFQRNNQTDLSILFSKIGKEEGKKSFLVFQNNKYVTIPTDQIAFFFSRNESTQIMSFQKQTYAVQQSLDQLQEQLATSQFYRLNRQYIINFSAVKEVEHYYGRKLLVHLQVPAPDDLLIGKEKSTAFLSWLSER
ncbi:response regulator transcription factor [Pseudoflavitalea sp. G-6-1-2]|uniref:LytR/AlgR family response regulator transcription factor n=1 Tax=Pseudoflavitalea sp. G-6-1-2 TaxID=2728841 RepID=UPI00146C706E|nr:LytTR family DNA-binding domain-containing protein [Pseudoflavitalea sp. G-6-1-2]NML22322.1 response regulator transcription factor [Pseudoflavitalea sp. G-6-1-2]